MFIAHYSRRRSLLSRPLVVQSEEASQNLAPRICRDRVSNSMGGAVKSVVQLDITPSVRFSNRLINLDVDLPQTANPDIPDIRIIDQVV